MEIGERYKFEAKSSGRIKKGAVGSVVGWYNEDRNFPRLDFGNGFIAVVAAKNLAPACFLTEAEKAAIKESLQKTGFIIDVEIPHTQAQEKFASDYSNVKKQTPNEDNPSYHWYPSEAYTYSLRLKTKTGEKITHRVEGNEVELKGSALGEFIWELLGMDYELGLNEPMEGECNSVLTTN